jgi:hypothetical protein
LTVLDRSVLHQSANSVDSDLANSSLEERTADAVSLLKRLDRLLERAVAEARAIHAQGSSLDPYRGLYVGHDEVDRLFLQETGAPLFRYSGGAEQRAAADSWLRWLQDAYKKASSPIRNVPTGRTWFWRAFPCRRGKALRLAPQT